MKYHTYKYSQEGINLDFSFPEDENLNKNKICFRGLLLQAAKDLAAELNEEEK